MSRRPPLPEEPKTSTLAADLLGALNPAKLRLADYCEYASGGAWERTTHLELICLALEAVERFVRGDAPACELSPDEACAALLAGEPIGISRLLILLPPRHGKLCSDDTLVPTPSGFVRHGDLRVGSMVFGRDGKAYPVLAVSPPTCDADVLVTFSDGASVVCHENHEWLLYDRGRCAERVVETNELFVRKLSSGESGKRGHHYQMQLPHCAPVDAPDADLIVDPYVLGVWLGNGSCGKPCVTHAATDQWVIDQIVARGYTVSAVCVHSTTGVVTTYFGGRRGVGGKLTSGLQQLGVYQDKHIPQPYLVASERQRRDLLAGLIDTDGCVDDAGRVRFSNTAPQLIEDVQALVSSLGYRTSATRTPACLSSSGVQGRKDVYQVSFTPHDVDAAMLPRKRRNIMGVRRRRAIASVAKVPPKMGRCIQVGSPDGVYLITRSFIPTHNSEIVSRHFAPWILGRNQELEVILTSYNDEMARFMSRSAREVFREATTALWGLKLKGDTSAVDHWELRGHKGKFQAAGVGGSLTGRGAGIFLIDDPEKNIEDAESPARQRMKWDWYRGVVRTRLAPHGAIVGIGTWWAKGDMFGRILEEMERGGERWVVIRLPAIAVDRDPLTDRLPMSSFKNDLIGRVPGEPLWPDRFPLEELEQVKRTLGRLWNGLYQQNPTGDIEGAMWRQETMIDPYRVTRGDIPEMDRIVISVDPSGSGRASADEVGLGVAGRAWVWHERERAKLRNGYVLEDLSGRYSPHEWAVKAIEAFHNWEANAIIAESNYGGEMVRENIHAIDPDVPVILVTATRGKARRAEPVVNAYEQGRVHHVGRFPELEEEMTSWVRYPEPRWSPNRMDWMVWAMTDLLIQATAGRGFISTYGRRFGLAAGGRRREGGVQHREE